MRLRFYLYLGEGEIYPNWYGVAWIDFAANRAVCYPIPLNIIVRAFRLAWLFCKLPFGRWGVKLERDAAVRGAK